MSLDTLNNGDSGLEARTKINAAIAVINATGTDFEFTGESTDYRFSSVSDTWHP